MKATDILKRFEAFLSRYEFEQQKLENGTLLEAEKFEKEEPVFIVTEDERVPLPVGDYEMEDGDKLIVVDEGVIGSIGEEVEEVKEEVQMEKDVNLGHGEEEKKAEMSYVSKEELEEAKDELKEMIEEVKAALEEAKEKEVEAGEEEKKKEEMAELSKHLAEPSAEPLRHNPEAKKPVTLKKIGVNRRGNSVMDRIMERISNIEN